jgi:hypothetical protein
MFNIEYINNRIESEVCNNTISKLEDNSLLDEYKKCKSVKNKVKILSNVMSNNKISHKTTDAIINEYFINLIPPGTKGVIRGNKFNKIVKEYIEDLNLDNKFEVAFEKPCMDTNEIPDWYICEKKTNKMIIGFNQLDIVSGGQQTNRGAKYLLDNKYNTNKSKLLCVICNKINFTSNKNKAFKLFHVGFTNNTLCYLNNLGNIIKDFFNIN